MHLYELKTFRHNSSPQVRKHVAKALRRLEAWSLLQEMAQANLDDARIQWFATAPTLSRMPFWAHESFWSYTPPKSVVMIRRMLRRIRHWVRWGVS